MKSNSLLSFLFTALLFLGCISNDIKAQGNGEYHFITIDVDGLSRYYMLYEPEGHSSSDEWPLVFLFHGYGGSVNGINSNTEMYLVADTAKFLLVIPEGLVVQDLIFGGSATGWFVPGNYAASHDDVQFIDAIIDDLIDNPDFAIDTSRIHTTGHSNGGEMSFYLACALSQRIASVGAVSAQMAYIMMDSICSPDRQVSTLQILGTEDPFFPVNGDETFPPLEGASEYWAGIDDCNASPTETELPDIDPNDNSTVTLLNYENCDFGFEVLCYRIEGGEHCWPGGTGACNNDINASVEVWNFFLRNPHPNDIPCYTNGVTFSNQSMIDNFQVSYPYCITIGGNVTISGNDITNLDGLIQLQMIDGNLTIEDNAMLESLTGFGNLKSIIGDFSIYNNNSLEDFSGLENLESINGDLQIAGNSALIALTGLENIDPELIKDLTIAVNQNLSYCNIESICYYLYYGPDGSVTIQDNATGCSDSLTVRQSCDPPVLVDELKLLEKFNIHPNPFTISTTIQYTLSQPQTVTLTFYNQFGKVVNRIEQKQSAGKQQITWNAEGLPAGIYYFRLNAGQQSANGKIVLIR